MSTEMLLPLLMRWVHILSAIVAVGGTIFIAAALNPTMTKGLAEDARAEFRGRVMKRWKMLFHPTIVLFLLSGFYNYIVVTSELHQDQPLYHILFGVKFLLALIFFTVVIVATSTMGWSERLRTRGGLWAIQVLIAIAIVMVAGVMKSLPQQVAVEDVVEVEATGEAL